MVKLVNPKTGNFLEERNGVLFDPEGQQFPLVNGAYRMVDSEDYSGNFGYQWNKFQRTQIDRELGDTAQSSERFFAQTEWGSDALKDKDILEVGSGAGRFTQVLLSQTEANIYSIDYSTAVEANFRNNGPNDRLKLFQASIYEMPFAAGSFDKVVCFGVLQHTPDFRLSIHKLCSMLKPGGELVIDFYPVKGWYTKIHAKYIFRPLTKRLNNATLLSLIENNAEKLIKIYTFLHRKKLGVLTRFIPVCDINNTLSSSLSPEELKEWVVLDTFDMFSPAHDHPKPINTVRKWLEEEGMKVKFADFIKFGDNNQAAVIRAKNKIL